jgi:hypothetical protein
MERRAECDGLYPDSHYWNRRIHPDFSSIYRVNDSSEANVCPSQSMANSFAGLASETDAALVASDLANR